MSDFLRVFVITARYSISKIVRMLCAAIEAPPPQRRLLRSEDPRPSVLPERPNDAADGPRGRRVMDTDGTRAWQLDGRFRGDPHPLHTILQHVIIMTRAPCRCSAPPSCTLRPAELLLHSHRRRSWHDSGTPGDGRLASCWTEAMMRTVRVFSEGQSFCYVCAYSVACACPWSR